LMLATANCLIPMSIPMTLFPVGLSEPVETVTATHHYYN